MVKLHLACGNNILPGYTNIDKYVFDKDIYQDDAIYLTSYINDSVDEIRSSHFVEHLDFWEEQAAFKRWFEILKPKGKLIFEVLDFERLCEKFLDANDDWEQFYNDEEGNYFGNGNNTNERWSVLSAHFYGNQSTKGNYHKNMWTKGKAYKLLYHVGFSSVSIETFNYDKFKELQCLRVEAIK